MRRPSLVMVVLALACSVPAAAQLQFGAGVTLIADTPYLFGQLQLPFFGRDDAFGVQAGLGFSFMRVAEGRMSAFWYSGHIKYYPWLDLFVAPYVGVGGMGFAMHLSYLGEELGRAEGQAGELITGGEFDVEVLGVPMRAFAGIGWTFTSCMTFEFLDEEFLGRHQTEGLGSYHVGVRFDF